MIQEERKIDLNKEQEQMREGVMQQYQSDVATAVAKEKQELRQKYNEEIEANRIKLKNECHEEYHKKYAIYLNCIYCKKSVLVSPDSELHNIIKLLSNNHKFTFHQECFNANPYKM